MQIIVNAAEVVTCAGFSDRPARGADQGTLSVIKNGAVVLEHGKIVAVGPEGELRRKYATPDVESIDAGGGVVLPGFVDAHTHLLFAGDRSSEWEQRMQGRDYLEILRAGGGIQSTVQATRQATEADLLAHGRLWLERMLALGTTTVEIKSGYGLDRETELRLLRIARQLGAEAPQTIATTYLGGHIVPPEFADDRQGYLELVMEVAAEVRHANLADYFDVFCESEAFDINETRELLEGAKALGYGLKLHAGQFNELGGPAMAGELGAVSVDHLDHIDDAGLAALADSGAIGTLLPGVTFHLGHDQYADGRRIIDAGVPVALATDFNPGSSFSPSMPMMIALATRHLGMTVAEAIVASTINGAHALGLANEVGSLEPGKKGDVIICHFPDHKWLGYGFGWNPVKEVISS